jgi:uncharacterized membrane protein YbhN (UPF0104 family)
VTRRGWVTALVALAIGGFAVRFGMSFPWARTGDMLADIDWLLLAAAALANILSLAAKAAAWCLVVRRVVPLRMTTAQAATFLGAAVGSVSISVSGEVARAQLVEARDNVRLATAAASLLVTRIVEALGLIVFLALACILILPQPHAHSLGLILGAAAAILALGYHLVPWSRIRARALGRWHEVLVQLTAVKRHQGLAPAVALATLGWVGQWLTYHWSIGATHVAVDVAVSLTALVMANLIGIFRLTPGNFGVMQGAVMLGMQGFAIPAANALAAGLALQAAEVFPVLAIGLGIVGARGFRRFAAQRAETV